MNTRQTPLGRLACLAALVLCTGLSSMGPAQAGESAPVAAADTFDSFYANASYDITAQMLSNDTGDSLVVSSVSKTDNPNVKVTLKGGKVTLQLLPDADSVTTTFTYTVSPQDDPSNMSEPVTDTVNVKHTNKPRFKKLGHTNKRMKVFNDNDLFIKVKLVASNYYHVDKVFKVPAHGHVTVRRQHRVQDWSAWMGSKKIFIGYGTIR